MKKKAQGLSLETIIIAVIVLIVLVVLIIIFSGKIGSFRTGINSCDGVCVTSASECSESSTPLYIVGCQTSKETKASGGNYCCKTG